MTDETPSVDIDSNQTESAAPQPPPPESKPPARSASAKMAIFVSIAVFVYLAVLAAGGLPHHPPEVKQGGVATEHVYIPPMWAITPFVALLGAIAVFPLFRKTDQWWHHNQNRLLVACLLGLVTLAYYSFIHPGGISNHFTHAGPSAAGWESVWAVFSNAILAEYVPFIVLLFALYVISGGITLQGDLPAHPLTNAAFLGIGALIASFVGTTGAAMVLIRPLLGTNRERRYRVHTVVFFIFVVCNCGGLLLPIGDPPLFLGYLRGVPFGWTLGLWPYWLGMNLCLLGIYYIWDSILYRRERPEDIRLDETLIRPLRLEGTYNLLLLVGVVLCVAFVVPEKSFFGTNFTVPVFLREAMMGILVVVSLLITPERNREVNKFDYAAIGEVAALFGGIFICMQVPIEILHVRGPDLGLETSHAFFWYTGLLSSFLDNAPTYVVFFETAASMPSHEATSLLLTSGRDIGSHMLTAISLGSVFMGANTYIGNGPNFMVRSIAQQSGVRMPSFFGYMGYSLAILFPVYLAISFFLP